jgi:hypothetical protein
VLVDANFVTAITKVAPLQKQTIPCLELLGAVLDFSGSLFKRSHKRGDISGNVVEGFFHGPLLVEKRNSILQFLFSKPERTHPKRIYTRSLAART